MKLKPITLIAALAVIGLGGFMAGRTSAPAVSAGNDRASASAGNSSREDGRGSRSGSLADRTSRPKRADRGEAKDDSREGRLAKLAALMRGEDPLARNRALLEFIDQLGPNDFESAIAQFREMGITGDRMGEYSLMLTAWAKVDPVGALDYAGKNTGGGFAQNTILTAWATTDPEAAIRWAQTSFAGEGANPFLPGIIRGLAEADPNRATALLTGMPKSQERGEGLEFLLPHLLQQGPEATRSWIASIQDDSLKNGAIIRTARDLAVKDPAATASWLLATPGEGAQRRIDDVFGIWASSDQQAALSKFSSIPTGEARSDALRGMIRSAAMENPKSAVAMMDRFPSDLTDRSVSDFTLHSMGSDPSTALAQVPRIADEQERDKTYSRALGYWFSQDPTAAQQWVNANQLPASVLERIDRQQKGNR